MAARLRDIAYRETPASPGLRGLVSRGWIVESLHDAQHDVLPDGWTDIVHVEGRPARVAGVDTGPVPVPRRRGSVAVGLRLAPAAAPALLGVPASELRDRRIELSELWGDAGRRLDEALHAARSPAQRLRALEDAVAGRAPRAGPLDRAVGAATAQLRRRPSTGVALLGDALGLSDRQLRRRFHAGVGYGPKVFARIARFQRLLGLAERRPPARGELAALALDAGYADQAHMTEECSRLAGLPPARLLG